MIVKTPLSEEQGRPDGDTAPGDEHVKLTLKIKLACAFGILILLFAGLYSVVLRKITEVQTQFSFVIEHDARMITDAQQLLKRVIDMETAQRTFCMTNIPDLN